MIEDVIAKTKTRMEKANEALQKDLNGLRTGRASPALVEHVRVDYYGVPTPIEQLATVSAPEARLLVVQPWDKTALAAVEKGILRSDLGLNPVNDGNVIRLSIPPLSEERRKEMVKLVRKRVEEGKVELRNHRRDAMEELKGLEKNKDISQDDQKRASTQLQKLTDESVAEADKIGKNKETELLEV
jgi:ribosome recycling factor